MNCHLCGRTTATSRLLPSASWCSNTVTIVNSLVAVSVGSVIGGVPPLARCRYRFLAPSNACDADEDIGELEAPRSARSLRRYQPRGLASVEAARRSLGLARSVPRPGPCRTGPAQAQMSESLTLRQQGGSLAYPCFTARDVAGLAMCVTTTPRPSSRRALAFSGTRATAPRPGNGWDARRAAPLIRKQHAESLGPPNAPGA